MLQRIYIQVREFIQHQLKYRAPTLKERPNLLFLVPTEKSRGIQSSRFESTNLQCDLNESLICYFNLCSMIFPKQLLSCPSQSTMKFLCSCSSLLNQLNHMLYSNVLPQSTQESSHMLCPINHGSAHVNTQRSSHFFSINNEIPLLMCCSRPRSHALLKLISKHQSSPLAQNFKDKM